MSFGLILTIKCGLGGNIALSLKKGILSGEDSRDEDGALFQCGVGGDGVGVSDAPASWHIVVVSTCDIEIGWGLAVVVYVDVGLLDRVVFDVSVGTDLGCCFCLSFSISWSFYAFVGKESISCNVQFIKSGYSLPVWSNSGME